MVIGDKVVFIDHPFYKGRYGNIVEVDENNGRYKVKVDIDNKEIWVWWEEIDYADGNRSLPNISSGYYDEHYRNMKVQPIMLAQDLLTPEELIGAMKFSIIKYSLRAGAKEGEPAEKDEAKKDRYREWLHALYNGKRIEV